MTFDDIPVQLYEMGFKGWKEAETFIHRFQEDMKGGGNIFVYQGKEFQIPTIPPTHHIVLEWSENDHPQNKVRYPVKVCILIERKPPGQ